MGELKVQNRKNEKGKEKEQLEFATVQVPSVLPRFIEIPTDGKRVIILLEEIIERNIQLVYFLRKGNMHLLILNIRLEYYILRLIRKTL